LLKKISIVDNFIVSARKYRPTSFDTVIGQKGLTTTLKNAIREDKLAHAYLFCGPRGVGKTTCARIFAKTINCEHLTAEGEACDACESCRAFNEGRSYNIHELDAASNNSVDDIRSLIEQVRIPPQVGRYKVFIIDEVHMLSVAAFNAFLKTLEEPPAYAKFILATTERHKVLPTILSRCQVYDFYRISVNDMVDHLRHVAEKEGVTAEEQALMVIAQKADGGMRDALSIFDQMVSYTNGNVTYKSVIDNLNILDYDYFFRFTDLFLEKKTADCMLLFNEILSRGFDGSNFIGSLANHMRDLLMSREASTLPLLDVGSEMRSRYQEQAKRCPEQFLYRAIRLCNDCDLNYRTSRNKRLLVELTLIQLSQATSDDGDDSPAGRRPAQLKPLFGTASAVPTSLSKNSTQAAPAAPQQQAPRAATSQPSLSQPSTSQPTANRQPVTSQPSSSPPPASQPSASQPVTSSQPPSGQGAPRTMPHIPQHNKFGTISIRTSRHQPQPQGAATTNPQESGTPPANTATPHQPDKPVDEEAVRIAWRTYAAQLPREETAMTERMNGMMPVLQADGTTFTVSVTNNLIEADLKKHKSAIETFMHQQLQNSRIAMEITIAEAAVSERLLTPRQQYDEMAKSNPSLKKLFETFDLDLV